jgi:hypothetical protein
MEQIKTVPAVWWLTSVIFATQEAEIRRMVGKVRETLSRKNYHKKGLVEWYKV